MTDRELDFPAQTTLQRPTKSAPVRRIQEWLCFHGFRTGIDGDFGPSTQKQVNAFRAKHDLPQNGKADAALFSRLCAPMQRALTDMPSGRKTVNQLAVLYARQHLKEHPIEIGGDNLGPWVRLYCMGKDGPKYYWCAGFATYVIEQAVATVGGAMPVPRTLSCDTLARQARRRGRFINGSTRPPQGIQPGDLFLVRKTAEDWVHTGLVLALHDETFDTIEGNSNDESSRNGYEVCSRNRAYKKSIDFVKIS
jgi:hypothetical protein